MKKPTSSQLALAARYHIPRNQAHSINYIQAMEYFKWIKQPAQQLERFIDRYYFRQQVAEVKQWI